MTAPTLLPTIRLGETGIGIARYLAIWLAVLVVFGLQGYAHDALTGTTWRLWDYTRWSLIQWTPWIAFAPAIFGIARRYPLTVAPRAPAIVAHGIAAAGLTAIAIVGGAVVSTLFEPSDLAEQLRQFAYRHSFVYLATYGVIVAIAHALQLRADREREARQASELATALAQSRLQVLKTQLQPHFLFNTLHAIITLIEDDTRGAEDMLLRLSDLLRAFLEDYDGQEIALHRELALLDLYLGIQRRRFKDRLETRIYVAPDALRCAVPSLVLQPLVENAIRHGIGKRVGRDCIVVEARRDGDALALDVRNDNSVLDDAPAPDGHGIGLSNTRLRLAELHGERASLRLERVWPQGVVCRIRVPWRELDDPLPDAGVAAA